MADVAGLVRECRVLVESARAMSSPLVSLNVNNLDALLSLAEQHEEQAQALRFIGDNAEAWHGDTEAKSRALAVIARTARTLERPRHTLEAEAARLREIEEAARMYLEATRDGRSVEDVAAAPIRREELKAALRAEEDAGTAYKIGDTDPGITREPRRRAEEDAG